MDSGGGVERYGADMGRLGVALMYINIPIPNAAMHEHTVSALRSLHLRIARLESQFCLSGRRSQLDVSDQENALWRLFLGLADNMDSPDGQTHYFLFSRPFVQLFSEEIFDKYGIDRPVIRLSFTLFQDVKFVDVFFTVCLEDDEEFEINYVEKPVPPHTESPPLQVIRCKGNPDTYYKLMRLLHPSVQPYEFRQSGDSESAA
jgi:hypothetical protein